MDNTKPHDWNSFVALLQQKGETGLLSLLYSYAAEEKGKSFEELYDAIMHVSAICNLQLTEEEIMNIYQTAPLLFGN